MSSWINRTLVQAPRNGTNAHTIGFAPAAAGSLLVLIIEGPVTDTIPAGWTRQAQALNNTELSVYSKTATAGEATFTTTHNGTNYPIVAVVYEFAIGSSFASAVSAVGVSANAANPLLSGLTGPHTLFAAIAFALSSGLSGGPTTWSGATSDVDVGTVFAGTDGYDLSVAFVDGSSATSFQPTGANSGAPNKETLTFAVVVVAPPPSTDANVTVTGILPARAWAGILPARARAGALTPRRWAGTLQ